MKATLYKTTILAAKNLQGVYERVPISVLQINPLPRNKLRNEVIKLCEGFSAFDAMEVLSEELVTICTGCHHPLSEAVSIRTQNIKVCVNCGLENEWLLDEGQAGIGYSIDEELK